MKSRKLMRVLFAAAIGGLPLGVAVSCDPYARSLEVFRFDDEPDCGVLDFLCDSIDFVDDCLLHDCHDDDFRDRFIIFD